MRLIQSAGRPSRSESSEWVIGLTIPPLLQVLLNNSDHRHDEEIDGYDCYQDAETSPLFGGLIRLIWMVVAVVDEVIRNRMAMLGVELLHEGLGCLLLLFLDLLDEIGGLVGT